MGRRSRLLWEIGGAVFTSLGGTLLHFLYDWSGNSLWAAAFSGVNESTWEHMKLLFFPVLVYTVLQLCVQKQLRVNFLAVRSVAALAGTAAIPILFYTYAGVLGRQITRVNLAIFYVSAAAVFLLDDRMGESGVFSQKWQQVAGLAALLVMAMLFVYFTFAPPQLGLWQDPLSGGYGIG